MINTYVIVFRGPRHLKSYMHFRAVFKRDNTCNYFIINLLYKKGYFKISKKYLLRPDAQQLELLLTSVMLC